MPDFEYYICVLIAIIIGVFIFKKVASCLFKSISIIILVIILALLYFYVFKG